MKPRSSASDSFRVLLSSGAAVQVTPMPAIVPGQTGVLAADPPRQGTDNADSVPRMRPRPLVVTSTPFDPGQHGGLRQGGRVRLCQRCGHPLPAMQKMVAGHRQLLLLPPERELFRVACLRGDIMTVQTMLASQPWLANAPFTVLKWRPLHYAAMRGHLELARILLEAGADHAQRNLVGETALETARSRLGDGSGEVAALLVGHALLRGLEQSAVQAVALRAQVPVGQDQADNAAEMVDSDNSEESTESGEAVPGLSTAPRQQPAQQVRSALAGEDAVPTLQTVPAVPLATAETQRPAPAQNAQQNNPALYQLVALSTACRRNDLAAVRRLLNQGAGIDACSNSGWTALMQACHAGAQAVALFLIGRQARLDLLNDKGASALTLAIVAGEDNVVRHLVQAGASLDHPQRRQAYALHAAASTGNGPILDLLLRQDVDLEARDEYGHTALHVSAMDGKYRCVKALIDAGAAIDARNMVALTPLHYAVCNDKFAVAKLLIQHNSDVQAQNSAHRTVCHDAAGQGQVEMLELLLDKGAAVDAVDKCGDTPLLLAVRGGHRDTATVLCAYQADTNHAGKDGMTALHLAASREDIRMAAILMSFHASIKKRDSQGRTAVDLALEKGNADLANAMRSHAALMGKTQAVNAFS